MVRYHNSNNSNLLADPLESRDSCGVGFIAHRQNQASHDILEKAFEALKNLAHRGAIDADGRTGDGAGVLTNIPYEFYIKRACEEGVDLTDCKIFGVAMIFYPSVVEEAKACQRIFKSVLKKYDIEILWERNVPVRKEILGTKAASVKPQFSQMFLSCPRYMLPANFEKFLYLLRKEIEALAEDLSYKNFYIPSMSTKTIVHKGLFMGADLREFYLDLQEDDFVSSFAVFHQRFSTNTFPSWALAQPFRTLAHNGEINTIRGNRNWMYAREIADQPKRSWVPAEHILRRIIMSGLSDSASFDNALEIYMFGGRSILHSIIHMVPEAWQNQNNMDEHLRAFYEFHACVSEHWGGPAAISFSDGNIVGTVVDRNGLRPARYKITKNHLLVCSEMGCVYFPDEDVEENGKLSPGKVIAIDLSQKKILKNDEVKDMLATQRPYLEWTNKNVYKVNEILEENGKNIYTEEPKLTSEQFETFKRAFGYTQEDLDLILHPMFQTGKEPVGSMGDDTPLSVFSDHPRLLYNYFKQLFAQVTNPPIDPIRESYVTSLRMYLGKSGNIFDETARHAHQIRVRSPIVTSTVFKDIKNNENFPCAVLTAQFPIKYGKEGLADVVMDLCLAAERAVDNEKAIIILSDRYIDRDNAPIPMLLAVSAVHQHLIRTGKRLRISLLVETGEAREVHHFACLIGFGASVIYPYLALQQAVTFAQDANNQITPERAVENYILAAEQGILKIMSKMGITVLQSYHAAQLFEAIGLNASLVKYHFAGTPNKVSGTSLKSIAKDYLSLHEKAFAANHANVLDIGGFYRFRREGERHGFHPNVVRFLHKAVMDNDAEAYQEYIKQVNEHAPMALRDLMKIRVHNPIDIKTVEPNNAIIRRFCTPGISYGAISKETHETFAIAMNRLGAKSDSGEGGEDYERFKTLPNGDSKNSAIKQVASARFGVTSYYLSQAHELEIKIAQGAKPGEGGQLPGHKVSADIARIRHSTPGVSLISPAPHHDIYSIEDLAQLIYDLKQANPKAKVCVKLVAEDGVGTIAAGVVKAHADVILISGHDGGTGASPLSSIKHAGLPWELGISETQQVLVRNKLRDRVVLRVDGGLKSGLDVVKAALLGAEEFGFGTASMVAAGCVMVRQCHLNTCPVGVATQDPKLRAKYKGTPERIMHMFTFIADDVRRILAEMGFKSLNEIIGRVDLLEQVKEVSQAKYKKLDLSRVLERASTDQKEPLYHQKDRNDWIGDIPFDDQMIQECQNILSNGSGEKNLQYPVRNVHRSVGAKLSYEIVTRYGPQGLPNGKINIHLNGIVGQSFGAFAVQSLYFHLEGEANDYVGKGLSGANLSLRPSRQTTFKPENNIICGNTCLYGATSGKCFVNGRAGERFAVRNSGAQAVVEGVGDHGCEYMTGGEVLILGDVGHNFGAGMTGGLAYVYDENQTFRSHVNPTEIELFDVEWESAEADIFYNLLKEHVKYTESPLGQKLLKNWEQEKKRFVRVVPKEILKLAKENIQKNTALK